MIDRALLLAQGNALALVAALLQRGGIIDVAEFGDLLGLFSVTVAEADEGGESYTRTDLATNLVIDTDRRTYHLELHATPSTYMASVSWRYPEDELLAVKVANAAADASTPVDQGVDLTQLRFRYAITGDAPPWRPLRAFDDGRKVYIEMPAGIAEGELPPLFVVGPGGGAELVNYRVHQNYYVVDRLFAAAELRLGSGKKQAVVRIARTDGISTMRAAR